MQKTVTEVLKRGIFLILNFGRQANRGGYSPPPLPGYASGYCWYLTRTRSRFNLQEMHLFSKSKNKLVQLPTDNIVKLYHNMSVRSKFKHARSLRKLRARAHAHSLEGTLVREF